MALHGGRVHETARRLGIPPESILDFSANLNPLGPPPGVLEVFRHATPALLGAYPDSEAPRLRERLCARQGVTPGHLVLGHGGAALLLLALRALGPKRMLVPIPCFQEQPRALAAAGIEMVPFPMEGLRLDLDALSQALRSCDGLLLTNPHNPTGQSLSRTRLLAWMDQQPSVAWVVDEAFGDYTPGNSLAPEALKRPRTVLLQSLTKFHAMPGVRVGHAFADLQTAGRMAELQEGWPVGELDLRAALAAVEDDAYAERSLAAFRTDAARFKAALHSMGLKVHPSAAPFFLVELEGSGTRLASALEAEGILIRTCEAWPGLGDRFIRLAVKEASAQDRLLARWRSLGL